MIPIRNISLALLCMVLVCSCSLQEDEGNHFSGFKLVSPKGYSFAQNNSEIQERIANEFGLEAHEVIILSIDYFESEIQSVAQVKYLDPLGRSETATYATEVIEPSKDNNMYQRQSIGGYSMSISCSGNCGCRERVVLESSGIFSYTCTCDDCTMTVRHK